MIPVHVEDLPGARPLTAVERQRLMTAAHEQVALALRNIATAFAAWPGPRGEENVGSYRSDAIHESRSAISADTYGHLVALAKDGDEAIFKEYAQMVGVTPEHLDALWTGTRRRVTGAPC